MKFYYSDWRMKTAQGPYDAERAVKLQVEHDAHSSDGTVERLQAKIDSLTGIVGRLIEATQNDATSYAREQAARIIGSSWDVK